MLLWCYCGATVVLLRCPLESKILRSQAARQSSSVGAVGRSCLSCAIKKFKSQAGRTANQLASAPLNFPAQMCGNDVDCIITYEGHFETFFPFGPRRIRYVTWPLILNPEKVVPRTRPCPDRGESKYNFQILAEIRRPDYLKTVRTQFSK